MYNRNIFDELIQIIIQRKLINCNILHVFLFLYNLFRSNRNKTIEMTNRWRWITNAEIARIPTYRYILESALKRCRETGTWDHRRIGIEILPPPVGSRNIWKEFYFLMHFYIYEAFVVLKCNIELS